MNLKKILSVILTVSIAGAMALPAANAAKSDEAKNGETELYSETFDMTKVKANKTDGVIKEIEVPDGDYTVTVTTGGKKETKANIYINGGERVRAYTLEKDETQVNEQPVVPADGKITVQVLGDAPNVTEIKVEQIAPREKGEKPTIYIAGDSTAQTYDYTKVYPQTGWGQVFADYFTDEVEIVNRSMGGRSAKSYNNDGRLDRILTEMHPGDYVFIQFGINDGDVNKPERYISVEDYTALIKDKYLAEVTKRGGTPVLMTASAASWWDEENEQFMESRKDYADPTREIAKETGCLFIDANAQETDMYNIMSKEDVLSGYFICEPLESKAYPAGTDDHTHLKAKGAKRMAQIIKECVKEEIPELAKYIKADEPFTDIKDHWAEEYITNAKLNGLVDGQGDGKFNPDANVTRAEFLKMAMDAAGIVGHAYREGECLDATNEDWYCYYLQGALDKNIVPMAMIKNGKSEFVEKILAEAKDDKEAVTTKLYVYTGEFNGNAPITREEMAGILYGCIAYKYRLASDWNTNVRYDIVESIKDLENVDNSYRHAVEYTYSSNYITGMGDGTFAPKENLTRAQATVVITKMAERLK